MLFVKIRRQFLTIFQQLSHFLGPLEVYLFQKQLQGRWRRFEHRSSWRTGAAIRRRHTGADPPLFQRQTFHWDFRKQLKRTLKTEMALNNGTHSMLDTRCNYGVHFCFPSGSQAGEDHIFPLLCEASFIGQCS